jgi:hypothetical protein
LGEGSHSILFVSEDENGQVNTTENFTIDTINPIINNNILNEYNSYFVDFNSSCTDTNLDYCNIEIDGKNVSLNSNTTLTHNGILNYTITARDLAGNTITENGSTLINPIIYFSFVYNPANINSFTFGGRTDSGTGYVGYKVYNDSLSLGENTLLFSKLGYILQNFTFTLTNTTNSNFSFTVYPASININILDRKTETKIIDSVTVQLIGDIGDTQTTTNGEVIFQALNASPGNFQIITTSNNYETETNYFSYSNQENLTINVYMLNSTDLDLGFVNVQVKDSLSFFVNGAVVDLLEWKPTQSSYISVGQCQTTTTGQCQLNIELNNKLYKFQASKSGITTTTNSQLITTNGIIIPITLQQSGLTVVSDLENVQANMTETINGNLSTTRLQWTDTSGVVSKACITTYKDTGFTQEVISQNCTSSSSGILFQTNQINNTYAIEIKGTVEYSGTTYLINSFKHRSIDDISKTLEENNLDIYIPIIFLLLGLGFGLLIGNIYISLFLILVLEWIGIALAPNVLNIKIVSVITVIIALILWGVRRK